MRYSILRKTISRKMVWGHAQPHHNLPKVTVNRIMNMMKESISRDRIRVSWAQNMAPNRINFRLLISSRMKGFPLTRIKGTAIKNNKTNQLKMVRRVYHLPLGFFAYTHFLLPFSSRFMGLSLNEISVLFTWFSLWFPGVGRVRSFQTYNVACYFLYSVVT